MPTIYNYLDYRLFLKDFYEENKKNSSFFSYRYIGTKVGIDAGNIVKILQGKRHLSKKLVQKFIEFCKFTSKEAEYFKTLINFNRAKTEKENKQLFEKLLSLKDVNPINVRADQYEFYQKWYYTAIAAVLYYYDFRGDYKALAEQLNPAISVKQAKESIKLLERLEFIGKNEEGRYVLTRNFVSTGDEWHSLAIHSYQEETIKLALESLENQPKDKRDISTVTITVADKDLQEIRELTKEYRKAVLKVIDDSELPKDKVYQLNVQLFPLTQVKGKSHGKQ